MTGLLFPSSFSLSSLVVISHASYIFFSLWLTAGMRDTRDDKEEEGILQLEYISFILHLLGSHLQSGPEVGGN